MPARAHHACGRWPTCWRCSPEPVRGFRALRPQPEAFTRDTQALANVLVVPPESLVGLVDAGLRLDHREALRFVALREDFATARVDGKSLQVRGSRGHA